MTTEASTGRRYGGQSADERRRQRRQRLITTGLELLKEEGLAKVTVTGVCAKAGLTDRYFYESFANRDALLDALFATTTSERAARVFAQASLSGDDTRTRIRVAVEGTVDSLMEEFRPEDLTSSANGESLLRHRAVLTKYAADFSAAYARTALGPGIADSPDFRMGAQFVVAGAAELVIAWLTGTLDVPREALIDKCADLIGYTVTGMVAGMNPSESPRNALSDSGSADDRIDR